MNINFNRIISRNMSYNNNVNELINDTKTCLDFTYSTYENIYGNKSLHIANHPGIEKMILKIQYY